MSDNIWGVLELPVNEWNKRDYMWSDEEGFDEEDEDEDELQLPLDKALGPDYHECDNEEGRVDVALYLINRGCGWSMHEEKLLCAASRCGKLGVVKELIEQHKVDPKSECDDLATVLLKGMPVFDYGGNTDFIIICPSSTCLRGF